MRRLFATLACLLGLACPAPKPPPETFDGGLPGPGLPLHDALSRPVTPTLVAADFETSEACRTCHADHVADWKVSTHAYAMADPVFQALVKVRQADANGEQDQFCTQCHTAIGVRSGLVGPGFSFSGLPQVVNEGVTCVSCHRVTEVQRESNAGHVLVAGGAINGPFADATPTPAHTSAKGASFTDATLCGSCHDVVERSGLPLERPFAEWSESPGAAMGRTCQDCHMEKRRGPAALDGGERELHSHRFVGLDVPLADGFLSQAEAASLRADVATLLATAVTVDLSAATPARAGGTLDVLVGVKNEIDSHNFPTGSTFLRQAWLELTATGADGGVLYVTGDLDANGDLRDHWSALDAYGDHDLVTFGTRFVNAQGSPELFPWRAVEQGNTTLPPSYRRTYTYFVPLPSDVRGPITVQARLRLRSHPPFLMRALGLTALIPRVEIHDLATAHLQVPLP